MKKLILIALAGAGLSGCVAVPVAGPGVYLAPPTVVVQPYYRGYYGYHRDYGPRRHW